MKEQGRIITINAKAEKYIGLFFVLDIRVPVQDKGPLWKRVKREAVKNIKGFPVTITMPCGKSATFSRDNILNLPEVDIPCPCGDLTHWMVKFEEHHNETSS